MLDQFYYSNLYIASNKKTSQLPLLFSVPLYTWITIYGMLYNCRFNPKDIELIRMIKPKHKILIPYSDIDQIELFVVHRKWFGGNIVSMVVPYYDFDLIIHLRKNGRNEEKLEIEIPGTYALQEALEILKTNYVYVNDIFDVFHHFSDSSSFKQKFARYFEENYPNFAYEYGLDNPRIGFSPTKDL